MKNLYLAIILLLGGTLVAQQNPQQSLFLFNKQVINPAYVGSKNVLCLNADYRWQWTGFGDGRPETFNFGAHTPIMKGSTVSRSSVGVLFVHDNVGHNTTNNIALQYAYKIQVFEKSLLSFGVEANGNFVTTDFDKFNRIRNENDPALAESEINEFTPNFGAGLYLSSNEYYVGVSASNLFEGRLNEDNQFTPNREFFAHAGYLYTVNETVKLRANVFGRFQNVNLSENPSSADINLSAILKDRFLLGASYRTDNTITAVAQMQVTNNLNVAYAYDFRSGNYGSSSSVGNSHEIFLYFDFGKKNAKFATPRFVSYF